MFERERVWPKTSLTTNPSIISSLRNKPMLKTFLRDETGLELSEYAVAAALIAIAVAGVFTALGDAISTKITELGGHIAAGN